MAYRQCSHCGAVTDKDETKCPVCRKNPLGDIITAQELMLKIKRGELTLSQIWTKRPTSFEGLSR